MQLVPWLVVGLVVAAIFPVASTEESGAAAEEGSETDAAPDEGEKRTSHGPDVWTQLSLWTLQDPPTGQRAPLPCLRPLR